MKRTPCFPDARLRRGSLLPAVVITLLVVMGVMAVVLNRLWIDTGRTELQRATDAAALAAAGALVSDDLLRPAAKPERRVEAARLAAAGVAARNVIAGEPLALNTEPDGDLRFGRLLMNKTGDELFAETEHDPRMVLVRTLRTRDRTNPLGLFLSGVSGTPTADLAAEAVASLDNHVIGLRAAPSFNVPAFPLAVLHADPQGRQTITWQSQIDNRGGPDRFGYDSRKNAAVTEPDGIPEIELVGSNPDVPPNACLVDMGNKLKPENLNRQVLRGYSRGDLAGRKGELTFNAKQPGWPASFEFGSSTLQAFREMKGRARIVLLYEPLPDDPASVRCTGFVAGRVMDVTVTPGASPRLVLQPAVLSTRAAVLASERSMKGSPASENPYIYKVTITR